MFHIFVVAMYVLHTYKHKIGFLCLFNACRMLVFTFQKARKLTPLCYMYQFLEQITFSRHQSLQIFEFQFSKSLFLFIEGGQENIFYWSKIFFGPMKNFFLSPFNE